MTPHWCPPRVLLTVSSSLCPAVFRAAPLVDGLGFPTSTRGETAMQVTLRLSRVKNTVPFVSKTAPFLAVCISWVTPQGKRGWPFLCLKQSLPSLKHFLAVQARCLHLSPGQRRRSGAASGHGPPFHPRVTWQPTPRSFLSDRSKELQKPLRSSLCHPPPPGPATHLSCWAQRVSRPELTQWTL